MKNLHWDSVPRKVRDAVTHLVEALRDAAPDDLVGAIVHGSAARGDFAEGKSDVDLILVLAEGRRETLERFAEPLARARAAMRIEAMLLVEAEIGRAADVFPLFYEDVCTSRAVIFGRDPFEGLVIAPEHRRLRIEQELREMRIRLRRVVIEARSDKRQLGSAVARKVKQLRFPLRSLLGLLGVEASPKLDVVIAKACKHFKVDAADLQRAYEQPLKGHDTLALLLDRAIETVDRLSVEDGS